MYGDSGRSPISSSKILVVLIIAVIVIRGATVMLNGTQPTAPVENDTENQTNNTVSVEQTVIGNNSMGSVTKYSSYGDASSDIHIALIVGVDQRKQSSNAIIPTMENAKNLKYAYDIYVINTTNNTQTNNSSNSSSNLTVNNMSESLANEYAVPDIINNQYNFSVDIHDANDSNSYMFVPSEDTFTSKVAVSNISNTTGIGVYTPNKYSYASSVSIPLISDNIPSIVYVTNEYYGNSTSQEISNVISALDNFDFNHLLDNSTSGNSTGNGTTNSSSSNNSSSSDTMASVESGNTEIK